MAGGAGAVTVRRAEPGDAAAIGEVHVRAWQQAYAGLIAQDYLDSLDPAVRTEQWRVRLSAPGGAPGVLVGLLDGEVAGFAAHGEVRDGEEPGTGQLYAVNVHPRAWRRGVGRALLEAVETSLAGQGFVLAVLWVVPGNARARAAYESRGWHPDGAEDVEVFEGVRIPVMRYRLPLR